MERQFQLVRFQVFVEYLSAAPEYRMILQRSSQLSQQGRNAIKVRLERVGHPSLQLYRLGSLVFGKFPAPVGTKAGKLPRFPVSGKFRALIISE